MKSNQKLLEAGSVSQSGTNHSEFEFPATDFGSLPNDVVFYGKVITRRTKPVEVPKSNSVVARLRLFFGRESRYQKSSSEKKSYSGMFGIVKFPLQMELSDIKKRQERREPKSLPKFPAEEDGSESCWELIRPLGPKGILLNTLLSKAAFRCIPIV